MKEKIIDPEAHVPEYVVHAINHPYINLGLGDIFFRTCCKRDAESYCRKRNKYYSKMHMNIRYYIKVC